MDSEVKFDIQTEGLGAFWGVAPDHHERMTRNPMSILELHDIIRTILEENDSEANGLIIVKRGGKTLNIDLEGGKIHISDPSNVNYQNIAVPFEGLNSSVLSYFGLLVEDTETGKSGKGALKWTIAIVAFAISFGAFTFIINYLQRDFQFMPKPEFVEVVSQGDFRLHLREMAGVYTTEWEDGDTLLNLTPDGTWEFYDIERVRSQNFLLVPVENGECRPVYQKGRLALLTENFYVFRWESEGVLTFQERRYIRTATDEKDVPFATFPNPVN